MSDLPLVTVLIPARNEEADIQRCLVAVLAQDYPNDRMEIVVVDGGSTDGTVVCVGAALGESDVSWRLLHNADGTTPGNLNTGLRALGGEVVCRVDARSVIPPGYVRTCATLLQSDPGLAVVGGAQAAIPRDDSAVAVGIARALNNRWGMGGSPYRAGARSGPTDTVYLGAFRTAELRDEGGWDPAMLSNQDFDLNRRMARRGYVWFESTLEVGYLPRRRITELARQYRRFGRWKVRYWRNTGDRPQRRQWALIFGPPLVSVLGVAVLWAFHSPVLGVVAVGFGVMILAGVEALGADRPASGPGGHLVAATSLPVIGGSWWLGVVGEWMFGRRAGT